MEQVKYYELSSAQRLLGLSQKYTLHKQINNVSTLFLLKERLDFDALKKAFQIAYRNNDTLRIRFRRVDRQIKQYYVNEENPTFKLLDFSGKTWEQIDEVLYKLAKKPFYLKNRCMSRVYFVRSCDGMDGIFWGVSHMILDAWGIFSVIRYIMDIYYHLTKGTPKPKPLYSHREQLIKDLDYKNTLQYQKDAEFWKNETLRDEPIYTDITGPSVLENFRKQKKDPNLRCYSTFTLRTKAKHEIIKIPKEIIEKMEAFCAEHKFPLQNLFMLGIRTALSKLNNREKDVTFYSPIARRSTLAEKNSGGTRVLVVYFRTIIDEDCKFLDALQIIRDRQILVYKHAEIDSMEVMGMVREAYHKDFEASYPSLSFTFQPLKLTLSDGTLCFSKWYCNSAASQPLYITMMDDNGSGGIVCYYEYQCSRINSGHIHVFHNYMIKTIMEGIANNEITIGELLNLEVEA